MLKINGKVWYEPLVNSCYVNDLSDFAGDATENECVLGAINWVWYHYPTLEEALEGLKERSPEDYMQEMYYRNNTTYTAGCFHTENTREDMLKWLKEHKGGYKNARLHKHPIGWCGYDHETWTLGYTAVRESSSWCISEMEEERYGVHHWAYRLHK